MDVFGLQDLGIIPPDRNKLLNNVRRKRELIAMCITALLMLVLFSISIHQAVLISSLQAQIKTMAHNTTKEMNAEQTLRSRLENSTKTALSNVTTRVSDQVRRLENSTKTALSNVTARVSDQVRRLENSTKTALSNVTARVSDQTRRLAKFIKFFKFPYQNYQAPEAGKGAVNIHVNQAIPLKEDVLTNNTWHFTSSDQKSRKYFFTIPAGRHIFCWYMTLHAKVQPDGIKILRSKPLEKLELKLRVSGKRTSGYIVRCGEISVSEYSIGDGKLDYNGRITNTDADFEKCWQKYPRASLQLEFIPNFNGLIWDVDIFISSKIC